MINNRVLYVSSGLLFLALLGGCASNNTKQIAATSSATNNVAPPKTVVRVQPQVIPTAIPKQASRRISPAISHVVQKPRVAPAKIVRKPVRRNIKPQQIVKAPVRRHVAPKKVVRKTPVRRFTAQRKVVRKAPVRRYTAAPRKVIRKAPARRYAAPRYVARKAPTRRYTAPRYVAKKAAPRRYVAPRKVARRATPPRRHYRPKTVNRSVKYRPRARVPQQHSAYLNGDFAGNPKATRFIDKMVSRHGFSRTYLNGILGRAKATTWMRKMAAKDDRPIKRRKRRKSSGGASWSRYRSHFLTSRHINAGVAFYKKNRRHFERAERQYGVPKEYIMGILGVETIFGGNVGKNRAIDALATMAFKTTRRSRYFESELESYILMTRSSRIDPLQPKASYAGALGLCQFMPSNIKRYGVDFDGDGGVNLWKPADAIASIARYFKGHGWRTGEMVAVPASNRGTSYRSFSTGFKHKYSKSRLSRKGVTAAYQHNMRGSLSLVKLKTHGGDELWLGGKNFYVITRYNHSTHYAMAVHQLAQAIKQRIEPNSVRPMRSRSIAPPARPKNRSISVEEAMELLSASNDRKDFIIQLRELVAKESTV